MRKITIFIVSILFIGDVASQNHQGSCNLEACYPKLTTNSSKLNALLVFGIFEVPLHEKCLVFARADQCFKSVLSSCQGPPKARKFHIDSWQNAKKLFDYICVEEYIDFNENQACLKELALSSGIERCDSYFSFKQTGNSMCDLPSTLSKCVEHVTNEMCPGEGGFMVPKIVKMVDMFLKDLININSSVCSPGHHSSSEKPRSHAHFGLENKSRTDIDLRQFERMDESMANIARHNTTDPPVHTFVVTRRYHVFRRTFPSKRRKYDEDDDDDADLDGVVLHKTGQDEDDRWSNGNQRGSADTSNSKVPNRQLIQQHHHHHRHHGYIMENNERKGSETGIEIDAEDEFGRRHRLKLGQARMAASNKEKMASSLILSASLFTFVTFVLQLAF